MKVYHYTNPSNFSQIKYEGLSPMNYNFIFALLSPKPLEWIENPLFPKFSEMFKLIYLKEYSLLEIELNNEDIKSAFVRDAAHKMKYERVFKYDPNTFPSQYNYSSEQEAFDKMKKTTVPLSFYLTHFKDLNYCIPEILLTKPVSPSKIKRISQ
ncbi:MAG: hypothetical protein VXZ40_01060 [Nanoarchaeota archaeon]|nr:hypothetical protein [Nanoarchaeota archaeon]